MAIISFFMLPEPGHLNGPVKLAKLLKKQGHKIYFFGIRALERYIGQEGIDLIPVLDGIGHRGAELKFLMRRILEEIKRGEINKLDLHALLAGAIDEAFAKNEGDLVRQALGEMIAKIENVKPDLFLADYWLLALAFIISRVGINTALLNPTLYELPLIGGEPINFPLILNMPVIHLCPKEFDLPHSEPKSYPCYYIGPSVDIDRKQNEFNWAQIKEGRRLIFCSFGSRGRVYSAAKNVVQIVIDMMREKPEWQMVLSLRDPIRPEEFQHVPSNVLLLDMPPQPNVLLLDMPPQLEILKRVAIMITHGGMNSVKECVILGVPMIVIPFDNDQPMNASRVVYHGLGLSEPPETLTVERLRTMVERIEKDHLYKTRVELMRERFMEIENSGIGTNTIAGLL